MPKPTPRDKKNVWRRRLMVGAVVGILASPAANYIARQVAVVCLGSLLGGNASISRVHIGLGQVTIDEIAVPSNQDVAPLLSIDRIAVDIAFWNGIRRGVWFDEIVVDRPQIQLQFSRDGTLLTSLPAIPRSETESRSIGKLPLRALRVRDGRVAIHQQGRRTLDIDNVSLSALAMCEELTVSAAVPRLFDAECELKSSINLETMVAESLIRIGEVRVSSKDLARLPLIPASVNAQPWSAFASCEVRQTGPLSFENCNAVVYLQEMGLSLQGQSIVQLTGSATARSGTIETHVHGEALGGAVALDGRLAFTADGPNGNMQFRCQSLDSASLPVGLVPANVRALASAGANVSATLADGMIQLSGRSAATVNHANIYGVAVAPVQIDLNVDGAIDLREESNRSHGMITVAMASEGVSLSTMSVAAGRNTPAHGAMSSVPDSHRDESIRFPQHLNPSGHVRGAAHLAMPLATIFDPSSFHLEGELDATGVAVNGLVITEGIGTVLLDAGKAIVKCDDVQLHDNSADRTFSLDASLHASLRPDSELRAEFQMTDVAAATVSRLAALSIDDIDGTFSAHAWAACSIRHLTVAEMWRGWAEFRADSVRVNHEPLVNCQARCELVAGKLTLQKLNGEFAGGKVFGRGSIALTEPFAFSSEVTLQSADIATITRIIQSPPTVIAGGRTDLSATADGEIASQRWRARGTVHGSQLQVGNRTLDDTRFDFVAAPKTIAVTTPPAGFLGGDLYATASLAAPAGGVAGPYLTGRIADVPVATIAKLSGFNEETAGRVSCEFEAHSFGNLSRLRANLLARSDAVALRNTSIKNITGRIAVAHGQGHLRLDADALGGRLLAEVDTLVTELAQLTPTQWRNVSQLPVDVSASATNVRLQQLWPVLKQQNSLRPLKGTVTVTVERGERERAQTIIASSQVALRELRWDNVLWSNQLRADLVLGQNWLELRELTGPFTGGRLTGRGKVTLDAARSGTFELSASRLALGKLLVPVDRSGNLADGLLSFRTQGRLGRRPSGRGLIAMERGEVGPIMFAQLHVPMDWSIDPASRSIQWRTTNAGLELGGGRVITNAKGRWNGKLDMSIAATARRVDTGRILKGSSPPGGFLDGTMRLTARRASGPEDFIGKFNATLSDTQSLQMPVLSDMTKFLGSLPTATSFDESKIQGRLGNGIVHIDRMTMSAASAQILVEGTATLKGRLNLQVMASTNESGPADKLLELADSPLMLAAPAPIAIVAKANDALKDRVIHLRVGGTAARPVIRLEPTRQLGQEAVKFFMNQTFAYRKRSGVNSF